MLRLNRKLAVTQLLGWGPMIRRLAVLISSENTTPPFTYGSLKYMVLINFSNHIFSDKGVVFGVE